MRRLALSLVATACLMAMGSTASSAEEPGRLIIPVQATSSFGGGWTTGKVVAVGIGSVVGVVAANVALPVAWGMANPAVGAVVGGMLGNSAHNRLADPPMLRRSTSMSVEAPSLFQTASLVAAE